MGSRSRHQRVFILGAGVSASCGIAVAKDILRDSILDLPDTQPDLAKPIHKLIGFLYPGFDVGLQNYPNIEDFLNLVEMGKVFNKEFIDSNYWTPLRLEEVRRNTLKVVTAYLWKKTEKRDALLPLYDMAERLFAQRSIVITFNWDLTLERVWYDDDRDFDLEYIYPKKTSRPSFHLLKPHGSIDWFSKSDLKDADAFRNSELVDPTVPFYYYPYFKLSKAPELIGKIPAIVPPIFLKEFLPYKQIWASVYKAIRNATELSIIGYSLPKEDQFARFVLRRALRNNIAKASEQKKPPLKVEVINPDPTVEGTFSALIGHRYGLPSSVQTEKAVAFRFIQARFDRYVESLIRG